MDMVTSVPDSSPTFARLPDKGRALSLTVPPLARTQEQEVILRSPSILLCLLPLGGCYWMIWDPNAPVPSDTGLVTFACRAGEIRRVATGESFANLAEALAQVKVVDELCLGEGRYTLGQTWWEPDRSWGEDTVLRLVGAGSGATVLAGPMSIADSTLAYLQLDSPGRVELEGLGFEGLPLRIGAIEVSLADLRVHAEGGNGQLLVVSAAALEGAGVAMRGARVDGTVPLVFNARGSLSELELTDNLLSPGYLFESYAALELVRPIIRGNMALSDEPVDQAIMAFGELRVVDGELNNNEINGPLLRSLRSLELQEVALQNNRGGWEGTVCVEAGALVSGGAVSGNLAGTGAFQLSQNARLELDGVDFGFAEDRNEPCDVALNLTGSSHTLCVGQELGEDVTASCDRDGCQ
jgi:hypothetical protein